MPFIEIEAAVIVVAADCLMPAAPEDPPALLLMTTEPLRVIFPPKRWKPPVVAFTVRFPVPVIAAMVKSEFLLKIRLPLLTIEEVLSIDPVVPVPIWRVPALMVVVPV